MDLTVAAAHAIEKATAAQTQAVQAVERAQGTEQGSPAAAAPGTAHGSDAATRLTRGGFVERVLGETHPAVTSAPAQPPEARLDKGAANANMQTLARPHAAIQEPQRVADPALPSAAARSEFALPAAQLVPATLVGLQVVHAESFPMPGHPFGSTPLPLQQAPARRKQAEAPSPPVAQREQDDERDGQTNGRHTGDDGPAKTEQPCGVVFADGDDGAWCEALTRVLRMALSARVPPHALLVAAEQWQRGRCVVLACPRGADPAGAAWAFVLWPRTAVRRRADGSVPPLELYGLRVEARLQWSVLPHGPSWCQVRVIKEHHPRSGRQLIAAASAQPSGRVPCEVQLGPVLARPLHCCDVCVRIHAAQRFWSALGTQWSMQVVVCSVPLLDDGPPRENVSC